MDLHDLKHRLSLAFSTGATSSPDKELSPAVYAGAAAAALGVGGLLFWAMHSPQQLAQRTTQRAREEKFARWMATKDREDEMSDIDRDRARSHLLSILSREYPSVQLPPGQKLGTRVSGGARGRNVIVPFKGLPEVSIAETEEGDFSAQFADRPRRQLTTNDAYSDKVVNRTYKNLGLLKRDLDDYEREGFRAIAERDRREKAADATLIPD